MSSPLLKIEGRLPKKCLLVAGEEPSIVMGILEEHNAKFQSSVQSRGFHTGVCSIKGLELVVEICGIGSAAIEVALQELLQAGVEEFVLAGTCGGSRHYTLGEPVFITKAGFSGGSPSFYARFENEEASVHPHFKNPGLKEGEIISSDAFYPVGGVVKNGRLEYFGAPANHEPIYVEKFRQLQNSGKPYLIDMETGYLYAFGSVFQNFRYCAVKGVSNYVPFDPGNVMAEGEKALRNSITASLQLLE